MDDANLNHNIDEQTQTVEGPVHENGDQKAIASDQAQLDPSRWWFASAAFPMVAGTLGPVASAFSICALVKNWRQHIPPGFDIAGAIFVQDPPWLLAVNAVQLVIALVANMFLLLNMTKRVRFSVAQPITIVGWYISAVCLIALCATASGPLLDDPQIEYVWSQAFYYGIFAAVLYFIVASLMVVTVWGAEMGHYSKDFELTTSQRTLMLQTIVFLMYLLLGALVFSKIEGWNYLDSVYWADVTLFTVGFGEISPQTTLGSGLLVPYALVGVITLGLVIGSIRSLILDRGKYRINARMLEKQRRRLIRRIAQKGLGDIFEPVNPEDPDASPEVREMESRWTEFERRQKEFQLMRKIQHRSIEKRKVDRDGNILQHLGGALGWSYFDGFYFAFTALTTIGYGDLTPISNSAKPFFVFWSLLALPTMTVLISNAGDTIVKGVKEGTLLLGNITILPGEHGFRNEAKKVLAKLSCGVLFMDEDIEESAPGFLGASRSRPDEEEEEEEEAAEAAEEEEEEEGEGAESSNASDADNTESQGKVRGDAEKGESGPASPPATQPDTTSTRGPTSKSKRASSMSRESLPAELPKTPAEYHLILIDEIMRVTKHLQRSPPRKYTFKEWAWYLRLIGEDESSTETHRRPEHSSLVARALSRRGSRRGGGGAPAVQGKPKWSWVGHRSPLMDTREEAEWILDKLEQKLREELQLAVRREGPGGMDALPEVGEEGPSSGGKDTWGV
ncbi:hypothetical protein AAE478_007743 [Parahypoxylon ruwenzoriense]